MQKSTKNDLEVTNFGLSGNMLLGYNESYGGVDSTKISAQGINLTLGYIVSKYVNFYGSIALNTTPSINSTTIVPMFVNALQTTNLNLVEGFFTVGHLNESPFYAYLGQVTLPYALDYAPINNNVNFSTQTQSITQRAFALGHVFTLGHSDINTEVFLFNGDTSPISASNTPTTGITIITDTTLTKNTSLSLKSGFITNIADTNGYQNTTGSITSSAAGDVFNYAAVDAPTDGIYGVPLSDITSVNQLSYYYDTFTGFATGTSFENITHRVAGAAFALNLKTVANITLSAAYSTALRPFSSLDLSFTSNGPFADNTAPDASNGARPSAGNIYLSKSFNSGLALYSGYETSSQALALGIPKKRLLIGVSKALDNFTTLTLEAKRDTNYGVNCDARGPYSTNVNTALKTAGYSKVSAADSKELGKTATNIVLQLNFTF